jgi:Stress responsive A/B Barrel Domain
MMRFAGRNLAKIAAAAAVFAGGVALGNWHAQSVAAQNRFGQPKTVVHFVVYKWKPTTSQNDKDQALAGIKTMAAKIPGVKNIWLKTQRNQIRDFDGVYAIEFTSAEAAADYAESPLHEAWRKKWEELRENSLSFQASNP